MLFSLQIMAGPQPAWDTRGGEEFSESGPNFLNYVQYFQTMSNIFFLAPPLITGLDHGNAYLKRNALC